MNAREEQPRSCHHARSNDLSEQLDLRFEVVDVISDAHAEHDHDTDGNADIVHLRAKAFLERGVPAPLAHADGRDDDRCSQAAEYSDTAHARDGLAVHASRTRVINGIESFCDLARQRSEDDGNNDRHEKEDYTFQPIHALRRSVSRWCKKVRYRPSKGRKAQTIIIELRRRGAPAIMNLRELRVKIKREQPSRSWSSGLMITSHGQIDQSDHSGISSVDSPAISVIIPVYNVERWLTRAVESLQAQTFSDMEIFLVDDGSTDTSGDLCDRLARKDVRIRVIHQDNAGAAAARNAAIEHARGEYLYFMDGDDHCDPGMLADMYTVAHDNDLDLLVTGFYIETYYDDDRFYRELRNAPDRIFASQEDFRRHAHELFDAQLLYAPWNKLYRRSYLRENSIRFPGTFWDDLPFNLDVIRDVERVGTLDGHYYHFLRARQESENTRYRADMYEKREEEHRWLQDLYDHWGIDSDEIQEFLSRRYAERLIGCVENVTNKNCTLTSAQKRAEIQRMISTPHARDALEKTEPTTFMMKVLFVPYRMQNVTLVTWESRFISFVKQHSTNLFARLKANR